MSPYIYWFLKLPNRSLNCKLWNTSLHYAWLTTFEVYYCEQKFLNRSNKNASYLRYCSYIRQWFGVMLIQHFTFHSPPPPHQHRKYCISTCVLDVIFSCDLRLTVLHSVNHTTKTHFFCRPQSAANMVYAHTSLFHHPQLRVSAFRSSEGLMSAWRTALDSEAISCLYVLDSRVRGKLYIYFYPFYLLYCQINGDSGNHCLIFSKMVV